MTRINVGYPVRQLTRQHLIAEHREIKRIPNAVKSGRANIKNATNTFKLGKGHVTFFYNKLGYLKSRYKEIYTECKRRGYNVQDYSSAWDGISQELMGGFRPTVKDKQVIKQRIREKSKPAKSQITRRMEK